MAFTMFQSYIYTREIQVIRNKAAWVADSFFISFFGLKVLEQKGNVRFSKKFRVRIF